MLYICHNFFQKHFCVNNILLIAHMQDLKKLFGWLCSWNIKNDKMLKKFEKSISILVSILLLAMQLPQNF